MKALFLIFHGLNPANGISKKIYYQVNALRACGIDTRLCYLNESNGRKLRMIDSEVLQDYGAGFKGKILKRIEYSSIVEYAKKENISFIYMRSDHNANPSTFTRMVSYSSLRSSPSLLTFSLYRTSPSSVFPAPLTILIHFSYYNLTTR